MALYNQFFSGGYDGVPAYTGTIAHRSASRGSTENLLVSGSLRAYLDEVHGEDIVGFRILNECENDPCGVADEPVWIQLNATTHSNTKQWVRYPYTKPVLGRCGGGRFSTGRSLWDDSCGDASRKASPRPAGSTRHQTARQDGAEPFNQACAFSTENGTCPSFTSTRIMKLITAQRTSFSSLTTENTPCECSKGPAGPWPSCSDYSSGRGQLMDLQA